jgi:hypothetical protein
MTSIMQVRLQEITSVFLEPSQSSANQRLWNASRELRDLFYEACAFDPESESNRSHIGTQQGSAIGPTWAAMCIEDIVRTRIFLLGIQAAIQAKLASNSGHAVRVLYVGCGPFATLLTPFTSVFDHTQLQIHCLEINTASIEYLTKLMQAFDIEKYFVKVEHIDAFDFQFHSPEQFDIIVCETLLAALFKEPQVALSMHLCAQMHADTLLIPELIAVTLALSGPSSLQAKGLPLSIAQCRLLELNRSTLSLEALCVNTSVALPAANIDAPYDHLELHTDITVYGEHQLHFNQSGLTIPVKIAKRYRDNTYLACLKCFYELGSKPGLQFQFDYEAI